MSYDPEICPKCKGKYDPFRDDKCPNCGKSVEEIHTEKFKPYSQLIKKAVSSPNFDREIARLRKQGIVK
jgi:predicted amidophosphoribosyltransferase